MYCQVTTWILFSLGGPPFLYLFLRLHASIEKAIKMQKRHGIGESEHLGHHYFNSFLKRFLVLVKESPGTRSWTGVEFSNKRVDQLRMQKVLSVLLISPAFYAMLLSTVHTQLPSAVLHGRFLLAKLDTDRQSFK